MMRDDLISTAVLLRELHCFKIDSLEDRIIIQKKIYLAEQLGLKLGYDYSWYIHGPYSTQLTSVIYECIPKGQEAFSSYQLTSQAQEIVKEVNDIDILAQKMGMPLVKWLELATSVVFWKDVYTMENTIENVHKYKPQFSKRDIEKAIIILDKHTDLWS